MLTHNFDAWLTDDFEKGIKKLLKDKKLRECLARNAKKFRVFKWEKVADKHLKIIGEVVRR